MVSGRPLLYLSLPGVAIIFGVFWYRRRYRNQSDSRGPKKNGGNYSEKQRNEDEMLRINQLQLERDKCTGGTSTTENGNVITIETKTANTSKEVSSKAVNIKGVSSVTSINSCNGNSSNRNNSDKECIASHIFGKSAPIMIVPNGKGYSNGFGSSSLTQNYHHYYHQPQLQEQQQQQQQQQQTKYVPSQQQLNCEELKSKIQSVELKLLCPIDEVHENLSSSVDLPDSLVTNNKCTFFHKNRSAECNKSDKTAIVIKASHTPKVSPENSFLECKYTKEELTDDLQQQKELMMQSTKDVKTEGESVTISSDESESSNITLKQEVDEKKEGKKKANYKETNSEKRKKKKDSNDDIHNTIHNELAKNNIQSNQEVVPDLLKSEVSETTAAIVASIEASAMKMNNTMTNDVHEDNLHLEVDIQGEELDEVDDVVGNSRDRDVVSPCLSLCSGDSGKGSSLPRPEAVSSIRDVGGVSMVSEAGSSSSSSVSGSSGSVGPKSISAKDRKIDQPSTSTTSLSQKIPVIISAVGNTDICGGIIPDPSAILRNTYDFYIPKNLIGYLVGKKRCFVKEIKQKTNVTITIRQIPNITSVSMCEMEGTDTEIEAALALIRQRFPIKTYSNFTMERVEKSTPTSAFPLSTESIINLRLFLIEGINNDVAVSSVISGGHLFVQHPLHPSHPSLIIMQKCLYDSYNSIEAPHLPAIELNTVCVLHFNSNWYRVQIVHYDVSDDKRCVVRVLDFGGYINVHRNDLRQIRSDFLALPFQATECVLSNVQPLGAYWTNEAAQMLTKLTSGIVLQAQIAGYNHQNIPEIFLFASLGTNKIIFINKELAARNLAKWVETTD